MNLLIKRFGILGLLLFGFLCPAQDNPENEKVRSDTITANMKNFRPRLLSLCLEAYVPVATGNKFIGKGMEGKVSFNFKAQMFVYKQAFFKIGLGETYFKVIDPSVTGNYQKTTISNQYLALGYEFLPLEKVRLGLSVGVLGNAVYQNTLSSNGRSRGFQTDSAKLNIYELYIDYELKFFMAITFNYAYRNDRTNIKVPQELQSSFDRAQFHNFGLGLKFYLGDNNIFQ